MSVRSLDAIAADPLATEAELIRLSKAGHLRQLLCHPNCPTEMWWNLASVYPFEAQSSVLYELLTLEEPGRWLQLEMDWGTDWIQRYGQTLSKAAQQQLAADFATRALPVFEGTSPEDRRPRRAIEVARSFSKKMISAFSVTRAASDCRMAGYEASAVHGTGQVSSAAWAAYYAAQGQARDAAKMARDAASDEAQELRWQWSRMCEYLRGDATENVGVLQRSHLEEIERALLAGLGQRAFRTDTQGRFARVLTNLGWLRRNAGEVRQFEIVRDPRPAMERDDVIMIAELLNGTYYVSPWNSRSVLAEWLQRAAFRDTPVVWHVAGPGNLRSLDENESIYQQTLQQGTRLSPKGSNFSGPRKITREEEE